MTYRESNATYITGLEIQENHPLTSINGEYSITDKLCDGLVFNTHTGVISGKSNIACGEREYIVSVKSTSGVTLSTKLSISGIYYFYEI